PRRAQGPSVLLFPWLPSSRLLLLSQSAEIVPAIFPAQYQTPVAPISIRPEPLRQALPTVPATPKSFPYFPAKRDASTPSQLVRPQRWSKARPRAAADGLPIRQATTASPP